MDHRIIFGGILLTTNMLACADSAGTTKKPVTIAYITYAECSSFCDLCRAGASLAKTDLTAAAGQPVEVTILNPKCATPTEVVIPDGCGSFAAEAVGSFYPAKMAGGLG